VQTLRTVSIIDLGRMSPCSLYNWGQQTLKPIGIAAIYADVFVPAKINKNKKGGYYENMRC